MPLDHFQHVGVELRLSFPHSVRQIFCHDTHEVISLSGNLIAMPVLSGTNLGHHQTCEDAPEQKSAEMMRDYNLQELYAGQVLKWTIIAGSVSVRAISN
jgi:hypothetical protein